MLTLSGILLSSVTVIFTFISMYLIDRIGRKPLILKGIAGIALRLLLYSLGFSQASYKLTLQDISKFKFENSRNLIPFADKIHENDVTCKEKMKTILGSLTNKKMMAFYLKQLPKQMLI